MSNEAYPTTIRCWLDESFPLKVRLTYRESLRGDDLKDASDQN